MIWAVVPAAGLSTRMGGTLPKPLLPWQHHTIIEQVLATLALAGLPAAAVVVVTGHRRDEMEAVLTRHGVRCVFNPDYQQGEMLSSLQVGLSALPDEATGALLALADQPQMELSVVRQVMSAFRRSQGRALVIPSYQMRRGHPVLLPRWIWPEVLAAAAGETLRTVINRHSEHIQYVPVDTATVLADLDTPEQYAAEQPMGSDG